VTTPEGLKRIRVYTLVVMLATVCIAQAGSVAHVIVAMMPFHWLPVAIVFGAVFPLLNVALALGGMVSRGGEELRRKYILIVSRQVVEIRPPRASVITPRQSPRGAGVSRRTARSEVSLK
jgi:hypothetical protein